MESNFFLPWAIRSLRSNKWGGFLDLQQSFTGAYRSHVKKDACVFSFYLDSLFRSHSPPLFFHPPRRHIVQVQYACWFSRAFIAHSQQCIGFLELVDHSWFYCWKEWVVAALKHCLPQKNLSWSNNERETKERLCICGFSSARDKRGCVQSHFEKIGSRERHLNVWLAREQLQLLSNQFRGKVAL